MRIGDSGTSGDRALFLHLLGDGTGGAEGCDRCRRKELVNTQALGAPSRVYPSGDIQKQIAVNLH